MSDKPEWSGERTLEQTPCKFAGKIALRDFVIVRNDFRADIKKGDSLDDIPEIYYDNLKTEGVI